MYDNTDRLYSAAEHRFIDDRQIQIEREKLALEREKLAMQREQNALAQRQHRDNQAFLSRLVCLGSLLFVGWAVGHHNDHNITIRHQ